MEKIKILCTGSSGLVGKALQRRSILTNELYEWNFMPSSKDIDLTNKYQTRKYFRDINPDIVIHLAGIVKGGNSSELEQFNSLIQNSQINTNVFEACSLLKVKKIISCLSIVMTDESVISSDSIIKGPSLNTKNHFGYIHSKRLLHALSLSYKNIGDSLLFCPVNIYGYDDLEKSDRLIPSLYRQIRDNKKITAPLEMTKSFIYNEDLAEIIIKSLSIDKKISEPIIVGGDELSVANICKHLSNQFIFKYQRDSLDMNTSKESKKLILYNYKKYFPDFIIRDFTEGIRDIHNKIIDSKKSIENVRNISLGEFFSNDIINENVSDVLGSGRLSYGKYSKQLESLFAKEHQCRFAILSNSGTSSLQVAIGALKEKYGWEDESEIIVPAITFVASINTILQNNLKPILIDVNPISYNIDVTNIEDKITSKTKAIMAVHLFGQPCDMDPIINACSKYDLRLIEDSCETMFASYKGKSVGSFGDISCFSTYNAHLLITGVGGLSLTNDLELAKIMRSLVNHGRNNIYISIDDDNIKDNNFKEIIDKRFIFERVGYSYRITELEAAIGVSQLEGMSNNISIRKKNAAYLTQGLTKFSMLSLPYVEDDHVFMMYPIVLNGNYEKEELIMYLENCGIETRNLMPITNQPVYSNLLFDNIDVKKEFPVAEYLNNRGFYIGCHSFLNESDLDYVINTFEKYFNK